MDCIILPVLNGQGFLDEKAVPKSVITYKCCNNEKTRPFKGPFPSGECSRDPQCSDAL